MGVRKDKPNSSRKEIGPHGLTLDGLVLIFFSGILFKFAVTPEFGVTVNFTVT